jgi:L-ectoine synthase
MLYALNGHERHHLRCSEEMRLICVFNPPLSGKEVHDKDGAYPVD